MTNIELSLNDRFFNNLKFIFTMKTILYKITLVTFKYYTIDTPAYLAYLN